MSYYACGPLSSSVVLSLTVCGALVHHNHACWWRDFYLLVTLGGVILIAVVWWNNLVRIARRTMPQLRRRAWAVGVVVPALWFVLAGLLLLGLPIAVIGVLVVFVSLG